MSLDERLKEILDDWAENWVDNDAWSGKWDESLGELLAQIKQAFMDEGYGKKDFTSMTGQEWLARFQTELPGEDLAPPFSFFFNQVMEAAERASGVSE